jgi:hypothetical protein
MCEFDERGELGLLASEVISKLTSIIEEHGDLPVYVHFYEGEFVGCLEYKEKDSDREKRYPNDTILPERIELT